METAQQARPCHAVQYSGHVFLALPDQDRPQQDHQHNAQNFYQY